MHDQAYMFIDKGYQDYYARFKKNVFKTKITEGGRETE